MSCIGEISILRAVDFFVLQGFHERLRFCVVIGIAASAHADLDAVILEQIGVVLICVLTPAIRMVNQSWLDSTTPDGHLKRPDRERRLQRSFQRPTDYFA